MRLISFRVREFKSVYDSNDISVGNVTCLVGKNGSGKTTLLQALCSINPVNESDCAYDVTDDYPRSAVTEYQRAVESGERKPALIIETTFRLEDELDAIQADFGDGVLPKGRFTLSKGYDNHRYLEIIADESVAGRTILEKAGLDSDIELSGDRWSTLEELSSLLSQRVSDVEETLYQAQSAIGATGHGSETERAVQDSDIIETLDSIKTVRTTIDEISKDGLDAHLYRHYIEGRLPKFFYFDEYYQMRGCENIEALQERLAEGTPRLSDYPLLGLIDLTGIKNLDDLVNPSRTRDLVNKLEGAGNHLTQELVDYWSQNRSIQLRFDVRSAFPGDPEGMRQGTNLWANVLDTRRSVTTDLGRRSRGFVWFFSFLAWYSRLRTSNPNLILLLDEPGLHLHTKGQQDLLRYFNKAFPPGHQVIYTTHLPFMVDADRIDRVRIVQDRSTDTSTELPSEASGTQVVEDLLDATEDSLSPVRAALAYEMHRDLFTGNNHLIVEGVADLMYLQTISGILDRLGRGGLSPVWNITPIGGASKIATFIALLGQDPSQRMAALVHFRGDHIPLIKNLFEKGLLAKSHVLTFSQFTNKAESDIEDMFDPAFFLGLINSEDQGELPAQIDTTDQDGSETRILDHVNAHITGHGLATFDRYRPARYLAENATELTAKISQLTLARFDKAFRTLNQLLEDSSPLATASTPGTERGQRPVPDRTIASIRV